MNKEVVIAHLTTVHPRDDIRIFMKECQTLSASEYQVHLCVADGKGAEQIGGIFIHDIGSVRGLLRRFILQSWRMFRSARNLNADIYHFHDPELLPWGVVLHIFGKNVIYDAHEDVPRDILTKPWIPLALRRLVSICFEMFENLCAKRLDTIVTATPHIQGRFLNINPNTVDINNFPMLGELASSVEWEEKRNEVCYVGGIASIRGIKEVVKALEYVDGVRLNLAGEYSDLALENEVKAFAGWGKVNEHGFLDRSGVAAVLGASKAGLVTFHPIPNHVDAQPNKMFEYMSAGIPLIASNFPLWKEIVEGNNCGICVDPQNPEEIAEAIKWVLNNPAEAEKMGNNGRNAVKEKYSWESEEKKLLNLYEKLML